MQQNICSFNHSLSEPSPKYQWRGFYFYIGYLLGPTLQRVIRFIKHYEYEQLKDTYREGDDEWAEIRYRGEPMNQLETYLLKM